MNIKPLGDRVVIEPLEKEETTAGGIVLPDTAQEKQTRGRVVAVGKGVRLDDGSFAPMPLAVGDEVIYGKYSGTEVSVGSVDYQIMRVTDVLAKVASSKSKKKK